MKRFFTTSFFALVLVIGTMGVAPIVHAQLGGGGQDVFCDNSNNCSYSSQAAADAANATMTATNAASQAAAAQTPTAYKPDSSDSIYNGIMIKIMGLFAWLVGVAALTLDYAVYYTVVNMGSYVSHLAAIGVTWRILRDIGNIALIFGFLAIGITTILNVNWYGGGKKMLPMMLVAAVFLNFSLFFSEAIIDVGNLFATQFYTQINGGVTPTALSLSTISTANEGISNKLMAQLGLQTIYNVKDNNVLLTKSTPFYVGFMAILLFIVTAFVMFSLAFILIARFVFLVFLIILAPIGFAGLAVPQLKARADKWWGSLFEQTITAPVLLLLLYVALAVITDAQFLIPGSPTGFVANADLPGFGGYVMSFTIAIGLMLAVTISAKKLSAFGAGKATALAGKLTFGATAFGMRRSVGYLSNRAAKGIRSSNFGATKTGRVFSGIADRGAAASFDIRGANIGGGLKGIGVEAGEVTGKGGYAAQETVRIKAHEKYANSLEGRGKTNTEKQQIAVATKDHTDAMKSVEEQKVEIERLEDAESRYGTDPVRVKSLADARTKKALAETHLNAMAIKKEEVLNKVNEDSSKKGQQRQYAVNIEHPTINDSPMLKTIFGATSSDIAAKKIKEAAKKKTKSEETLEAYEAQLRAKIEKENTEKPPSSSQASDAPETKGSH